MSVYSVFFVTGGFGVLKQLLHLSARVRVREEEREEERLRQTPTQTVLTCFMLGWFIIGKPFYQCNRCIYQTNPISLTHLLLRFY